MHRLDPYPIKLLACLRYIRDIPHSLPGINREASFTQRNKRITSFIYFRNYMESTPGSCLSGKVLNQFGQVRMSKLGGGCKIKQLGKGFLRGMDNAAQDRFFSTVGSCTIDMPLQIHIGKQPHRAKWISTR